MTFDAFWELFRWLLLPALAGLAWWIDLNQLRNARDLEKTEERLTEAMTGYQTGCIGEVSLLKAQHASFQLEVVRSYARTDQLERALDRISASLGKIEQKIEDLRREKVRP